MEEYWEAREDTLLNLAALCGDLPIKLLDLLSGSPEWTRKTASALRADKLLARHRKNGVPSLRLTKKGRELLLRASPERFSPIFTEAYLSRCRKSDPISVERLHRMAAVYLLLLRAGVHIYPDEKPAICSSVSSVQLPYPVFYSSLEIKGQGIESTRIKATRAAGVLFTSAEESYLVYHTGSSPLKWSAKAEQKLIGAVNGIRIRLGLPPSECKGLMLGSSMDTALSLLQSEGGNRRQYFRLDGTFPVMRYAPCDENGIRLLRSFCRPHAHKEFIRGLSQGSEAASAFPFDCDGTQDGLPVLFACDLNLERIRRYKTGLELFGKRGAVYCFDFQARCLSAYFGVLAEICLIPPFHELL